MVSMGVESAPAAPREVAIPGGAAAMTHRWRLVAATAAMAWLGAAESDTRACCPAWRIGHAVTIADQKILVVWDPDTKTEHFIRSAGFRGTPPPAEERGATDSDGGGFGFLVPSPTQPEVAAADGAVFAALDEAVRPRIEVIDRWKADPMPLLLMPFVLKAQPTSRAIDTAERSPRDVVVLERKQVGQYDVAVLQADDASALTAWLATNGFDSRPALEEWAEPYVAKGWIITAFRYAAGGGRIDTGAVRMSFRTDVPMFAYRVPADNIARGDDPDARPNLLRAYLVLPGRANGSLGEGEATRGWQQAQCRYARPLGGDGVAEALGTVLPAGTSAPAGAWLTAFDDRTWPSGTDDLRFTYHTDGPEHQEVVRRFRDRAIPVPLDVVGLAVAATAWGVRRRFV